MTKKKNPKVANLESTCKNCDTVFVGNFCPNCGQSLKEFERPFGFLFIDLMGNIFAFDTRFWKTFKAILFKPGVLALEFVKGHRVRYMPPFRFYVFISFIFFLLININVNSSLKEQRLLVNSDSTNFALEDSINFVEFGGIKIEENKEVSDSTELDKAQEESVAPIDLDRIQEYPEVYFSRMFKYLSWTVFLLMPFYGLLLRMFYFRSQPYYITSLILAINQHSFAFVIFLCITLLSYIIPGDVSNYGNFMILIIPVYVFIGQKKLYSQKWWSVLLKMQAIGFLYFSVLFITVVIILIFAFEFDITALKN